MPRQTVILVVALLAAIAGGVGVWAYNQNNTVLDVNVGGQRLSVQAR
ncbi:hypothetical protein [Falsiroseomonas stagni]|uniref:Uncharacterized protein n=1 Tax=Falsiroseomonas stagni DSM 19981 TaxID=1123062 RepID=A0A1I3Z2E2_9PROT|nr:hypothetical protein [Falsiroseomonas stagni]SFK38157.1 hypothetical protein SAMN02745775_10276 [Falsiroseomonas stagni DSM 19981]